VRIPQVPATSQRNRGRGAKKNDVLAEANIEAMKHVSFMLAPRKPGETYSDTEKALALQAFVLSGENYTRCARVTGVDKARIRDWWLTRTEAEQQHLRDRVMTDTLGDMQVARSMALMMLIERMPEANVFELTGIIKTMNEQAAALTGRATQRVEHIHFDAREVLAARLESIKKASIIEGECEDDPQEPPSLGDGSTTTEDANDDQATIGDDTGDDASTE
jgi:hypothetical protein